MRINQNIAAFNAYRNLSQTQDAQAKSLEKLSSGFRINRAADDASGLVNSENLRAQIGGLKVATRNAQDAISLVQTAEGAQTEVHSILQRIRDLVVQSGNTGTNDAVALQANQDEIVALRSELDRIADQTQFGTQKILVGVDGDPGDPGDPGADPPVDPTPATPAGPKEFTFQVGANAGQTVTVGVNSVSSASLGIADLTVVPADADTPADIDGFLEALDGAIQSVSANRAELGAFQNRMESTIRNISVAVENLSAAESRIRDTDMASEMVNFTRHQILSQAGTAMLAQANLVPQSVLSLLR